MIEVIMDAMINAYNHWIIDYDLMNFTQYVDKINKTGLKRMRRQDYGGPKSFEGFLRYCNEYDYWYLDHPDHATAIHAT
jgi:hypothetical protein